MRIDQFNLSDWLIGRYKISFKYSKYLHYFKGKNGLEIGGPSQIFNENNIFPLYSIVANLDNCNFSNMNFWRGAIKEGNNYEFCSDSDKRKGFEFICEATNLCKISSESYDFILASHVIEHIANPLKAITEWLRVLKKGGAILMVIPCKDRTFDHRRSVSSLRHIIEDFQKNTEEDDLSHLAEILEFHDLKLDPEAGEFGTFKKRSLSNFRNRCLHHHVFDPELAAEIFNYLHIEILFIDIFQHYNIFIMGKKNAAAIH